MKIAIMQPYTFPYIGYFQLINYADKWVIFDDTQYISKGWINRNRMLHPDLKKEWQYFTVPVKKHSRESRINTIEINDNIEWRVDMLRKFIHYKKKAPFYKKTSEFLGKCINLKCSLLSEWIAHTLKSTCDYLEIPFEYSIFSQNDIDTKKVTHAGQWALEIADAMNAEEYVNPLGGYSIFNEDEFQKKDIQLRFLKPNLTPYIQRRDAFASGLSIIDVMMWNNKESIKEMLQDYQIMTQTTLRAHGCD